MTNLDSLLDHLRPLRVRLLNHPIYQQINSVHGLRVFMEHHVFAVWDFMSLLKTLQNRLTCVSVPWLPGANPGITRLINEIVLAEESDSDGKGGYFSHFDLYHQAMKNCGADTVPIDRFLLELRQGASVVDALEKANVASCVTTFVSKTFQVIESGDICGIASTFTFGRESLLPGLFEKIVAVLNQKLEGGLGDFHYYLERHIGLDGDEHGPMANQLMETLCGSDRKRWQTAEQSAWQALEARLQLWDSIQVKLQESETRPASRILA